LKRAYLGLGSATWAVATDGNVAPRSRNGNLARKILRSCQTAGKDVPAGTMAMVSSTVFLRASERPTAISTLNRQRHLTPSCGWLTPTAERTVGPARMIVGELDSQTRNFCARGAQNVLLRRLRDTTPSRSSTVGSVPTTRDARFSS